MVSRTQPSGPLCLWQCFYTKLLDFLPRPFLSFQILEKLFFQVPTRVYLTCVFSERCAFSGCMIISTLCNLHYLRSFFLKFSISLLTGNLILSFPELRSSVCILGGTKLINFKTNSYIDVFIPRTRFQLFCQFETTMLQKV